MLLYKKDKKAAHIQWHVYILNVHTHTYTCTIHIHVYMCKHELWRYCFLTYTHRSLSHTHTTVTHRQKMGIVTRSDCLGYNVHVRHGTWTKPSLNRGPNSWLTAPQTYPLSTGHRKKTTYMYKQYIQWNLSIMDTLRTTWSVLIKKVSLFQRMFSTLLYVHVAGTTGSVLIREVSLIQRVFIREVPL